jgi:adenine-specific DNA-methyltransferase
MKQEIDAGNIVFGEDEKRIPSIRRNLFEKDEQVMRSVVFSYAQKASQDFAAIFDGKAVFQNPKSFRDMHRLVSYFTDPGDIVLDFFAGSGTTGHGTFLASTEALPSRRFILVQLPEPLDPSDKDQKLAAEFCDSLGKPGTIAELTKERLRRAGKIVRTENPLFGGDVGFRVFKLDSSNIRAWNPASEAMKATLLDHAEHLLPGRTNEDILTELLLKLGLDLCVPTQARSVGGKPLHSIAGGVLITCLASQIEATEVESVAQSIVAWHRELSPAGDTTCVFRDSAFADDVAKTNMAAILEQNGIANVRSL